MITTSPRSHKRRAKRIVGERFRFGRDRRHGARVVDDDNTGEPVVVWDAPMRFTGIFEGVDVLDQFRMPLIYPCDGIPVEHIRWLIGSIGEVTQEHRADLEKSLREKAKESRRAERHEAIDDYAAHLGRPWFAMGR